MKEQVSRVRIAEEVLARLDRTLKKCNLCFRKCGVDRTNGEKGYCAAGADLFVYAYGPHRGEEPSLSGSNGSGTIFFSGCNMGCVYCQNHKFSRKIAGSAVNISRLADMMLELEAEGCHNINLVSPTPFMPQIVDALKRAFHGGLSVPIVYNTGGYDSLDLVRSLDGLIDIYLPDMRYSDDSMAEKYSDAPGYVKNNRAIVREMFSQTGTSSGMEQIAKKGLIIRLLMLPEDISGTLDTLEFIAKEIGPEVHISLMSQYYPAYIARAYPDLTVGITPGYYDQVVARMNDLGLEKGWIQPLKTRFDPDLAGENFQHRSL